MRRALKFAAVATCLAGPASATLLCVGTDPAFLLSIDRNLAEFDYLGDAPFEIVPPIDETEVLRSTRTHVLLTGAGRLPLLIKPRACEVLSAQTPLSLEILVTADQGPTSFRGCCLILP